MLKGRSRGWSAKRLVRQGEERIPPQTASPIHTFDLAMLTCWGVRALHTQQQQRMRYHTAYSAGQRQDGKLEKGNKGPTCRSMVYEIYSDHTTWSPARHRALTSAGQQRILCSMLVQ